MPFTTIDSQTALIVIDLQKGILSLDTCHPTDPVMENCIQLLDLFRQQKRPVVLVNVAGGAPGRNEQTASTGELPQDWAKLDSRLKQQESDHCVTKKTWGAFTDTDLDLYLKKNAVTQVIVVGIATSIGVESTARQAHELGYNVALVNDAMTDLSLDAHNNSINILFPRLAETGTTMDLISLLTK